MRRLLSIAAVTLRDVARSRLAATLSFSLVVLVAGLPSLLSGGVAGAGRARVASLYTLAVAMGALSFASVWMAAAGMSSGVRTRTVQLVRVKPVPMRTLWLGNWLAFLLLDALLLAGILLLLCGRVALLGGGTALFGSARHRVPPLLPSVEDQADATCRRAAEGQDLTGKELRALRSQIRARIPYAAATLGDDDEWKWDFDLPRALREGEHVVIRANFDADAMTRGRACLDCSLGPRDGEGDTVRFRMEDLSAREIMVTNDVTALAGLSSLTLSMRRDGAGGGLVMLRPRQDLVLLQEAGPFRANLLRCYLVMLSVLAVLVAIGLSFGALFSLPVAVFCSAGLVLAVLVGRYAASDPDAGEHVPGEPRQVVLEAAVAAAGATSRLLSSLSDPFLAPSPAGDLADGEWIPRGELVRACVLGLAVIPAILALAVSVPMARRELPE